MGDIATRWAIPKAKGLKGGQFKVLAMLAYHRNDKTGLCNPSRGLLAEETGMSERHIDTLIAILKAKGLIDWKTERGSNYYRLLMNESQQSSERHSDARASQEQDQQRRNAQAGGRDEGCAEIIGTADRCFLWEDQSPARGQLNEAKAG